MKLCKNCIHMLLSEAAPHNLELSRCGYERPISLVSGEPKAIPELPFAEHERRAHGNCKPTGDHYAPIPSPLSVEEEAELLAGDIRHE